MDGKILALLLRPYSRGRDYYDLIWYLGQKIKPNLAHINRASSKINFKDEAEVIEALRKKVESMKPAMILKDIGPFLEDPSESTWIAQYKHVFESLIKTTKTTKDT